jgi:hypothetical protein
LYIWEDMARKGRQNPGTRSGGKLAYCLYVCVEAISNRSSKDSSCAHKGLVTNWLHHTRSRDPASSAVSNVQRHGLYAHLVPGHGVRLLAERGAEAIGGGFNGGVDGVEADGDGAEAGGGKEDGGGFLGCKEVRKDEAGED